MNLTKRTQVIFFVINAISALLLVTFCLQFIRYFNKEVDIDTVSSFGWLGCTVSVLSSALWVLLKRIEDLEKKVGGK